MSDILEKIGAYKRDEVASAKKVVPLQSLEQLAELAMPTQGFEAALRKAVAAGQFGLIAELKKASPSRGVIREDFDVESLAKAYQAGGASCLSVLTDKPSFQGAPQYLTAARNAVQLPVLRKDFLYDPYQVVEARAWGADAVLLIMAAIDDETAQTLEAEAKRWGMDVLVEVHNDQELERALRLKSRMIGINNRDLKTFDVDLAVSEQLVSRIPEDYVVIGESGIHSNEDCHRLAKHNINCFLVGESLMRHEDVAKATQELIHISHDVFGVNA